MAKHKLANYPTAELAHLKINSLLTKLGRAQLPESQMIAFFDQYLAKIDELEEELAAKGSSVTAPTPPAKSTPSAQRPAETDPIKPALELKGIQRAAHAQRSGKTAKPANPPSALPSTGYGRAARAQQIINDRKNKS